MKLYGKRFVANRTETRISDRKESRDAIVYDIDEANRWCRVRVAGSDILVRAWFPTNFMRTPVWLKVNIAVRITHVGGDKSRIEVVSPGLVQPTYVMAPMSGGVNAIFIGMYPTAPTEAGTGWVVRISQGTYRINGVTYSFTAGGPVMNLPGWHMGDPGDMSGTYWLGNVDPIAAVGGLWFRYDAFVIGIDGVVDYVKGDEWEWISGGTGPIKPEIPINHVLIRNYILVWSGVTAITQQNIGREWEAPHPESLSVEQTYSEPFYELSDDEQYLRSRPGIGVVYGGPITYVPATPSGPRRGTIEQDMQASATITVMDQYGNPYSWWASGSVNQLEFSFLGIASYDKYGTASLGVGADPVPDVVDESGYGPTVVVSLGLGSSYEMNYTRMHTQIEQSNPALDGYPNYQQADIDSHTATIFVRLISAETTHPVSTIITMWNVDAGGNPQ